MGSAQPGCVLLVEVPAQRSNHHFRTRDAYRRVFPTLLQWTLCLWNRTSDTSVMGPELLDRVYAKSGLQIHYGQTL